MPRLRQPLLACALCSLVLAPTAMADLGGQIDQSRSKDRQLQSAIHADNAGAAAADAKVQDIQARLDGLNASAAAQQKLLDQDQSQLRAARARLARLKLAWVKDRQLLAATLTAQYEADPPDLVSVVLSARGFAQLLETAESMKRVRDHNTDITTEVRKARTAVTKQAADLKTLEAHQKQVTDAVTVERDQVAGLHLQLVQRRVAFEQARDAKSSELASLRSQRAKLVKKYAAAQARAAAVAAGFSGAAFPKGAGLPSSGAPAFNGHGGNYGFFPAAGTNYSVGEEPELASRLDLMGKQLQLHLIGLSGYRTPQHSVEVGGFANDPHTQGRASDTPGVEGLSEATLNRFGLTRPFPGPAEADHVQLLGG
jgi:peptidoglycan hydrolase CwlO-like protein